LAVVENLRLKLTDTKLVLVADNDADKQTNIGVQKATEAARSVDGFIAVPDAPEGVKVDVNDLMLAKGQGAVRTLLEGAKRPEPLPQHDCLLINLSDVVSKPIEWLWPDRFPLGKLCLIGGPPSMGKTQIALWIAANVTTGGKWPDSEQHATIGDVIILSTEDDVADTLKPRLEAAGADVSRVHVLHAVLEVRDDEDR
jgi:putative DNA primase/helicase